MGGSKMNFRRSATTHLGAMLLLSLLLLAANTIRADKVLCPGQPKENYCDCDGDCNNQPNWCSCQDAQECCSKQQNNNSGSDKWLSPSSLSDDGFNIEYYWRLADNIPVYAAIAGGVSVVLLVVVAFVRPYRMRHATATRSGDSYSESNNPNKTNPTKGGYSDVSMMVVSDG